MLNHTVNNKICIGSRVNWLCTRLAQTLALILLALFGPLVIDSNLTFVVIFGTLMFYTFAKAHQVVQGFADDQGLHFKRYLTWKCIPWAEVESITKQSVVMITVNINGSNFLNKRLVFLKNIDVLHPFTHSEDFTLLKETWMHHCLKL